MSGVPPSAFPPAASQDDPSIPGVEAVYRRLSDSGPSMIAVDVVTGARRPSTGAFKPDADGVSVYRESKLHEAGLAAADVVKAPQNLVVSLRVGEVRDLAHLGVRDDPWPADAPDVEHPRNEAHALIVGWDGLTKGQRRERQLSLVSQPSLTFVYP